jgi:hypothetical protein
MNKILSIVTIAAFTLMSFGVFNGDGIINALKAGNADQLSTYFDNTIDVKLPNQDEAKNTSKAHAAELVKTFFSGNGIKGFDLTSQREMAGTMYITGKLQNGGSGFNITLMIKNKGDNSSIITLRIN